LEKALLSFGCLKEKLESFTARQENLAQRFQNPCLDAFCPLKGKHSSLKNPKKP